MTRLVFIIARAQPNDKENNMSVFERLNAVNVNGHTEKKNGLTYLSWAWAWAELLKAYPDSTYTVYENKDGWCYHTDGKTAWVKTGVTVEGKEYIEMLPVMDFKNRSIPLENITSMDVNKAIQRSLTKAVARHGLGLYIYAGEDLPEDDATAGAVRVQSVDIKHPVADTPAAVTVEDPKAKALHSLRMDAKLAYGSEADNKLAEMYALYSVTAETMTNEAYKLIRAQILEDLRKKGAA